MSFYTDVVHFVSVWNSLQQFRRTLFSILAEHFSVVLRKPLSIFSEHFFLFLQSILNSFTIKWFYLWFYHFCRLRPATLLKKRIWHRCFPVKFAKFLRTTFLQNTLDNCFWRSSMRYFAINIHYVEPRKHFYGCFIRKDFVTFWSVTKEVGGFEY